MEEERCVACPVCGMRRSIAKGDGRSEFCKMCNVKFIDLGATFAEFCALSPYERDKWNKNAHETIIRPNPLYDEDAHQAGIEFNLREIMSAIPEPREHKIVCPYCGYDKYQMVARKWSLLTGFLTNKVDRVCEKCKKRF